jgi:transcriptional repressor NrdR
MRCPDCDTAENRVVDSRISREGRAVRRRRECLGCATRFTTYEYIEERTLRVLKGAGDSEDFDREKLRRGIEMACAKRPIAAGTIDQIVDEIEDHLSGQAGPEIPSGTIGEMVMDHLRPLDRVAYVRFASVYRNFQDVGEFQDFVDDLTLRELKEGQTRNQVELPI